MNKIFKITITFLMALIFLANSSLVMRIFFEKGLELI